MPEEVKKREFQNGQIVYWHGQRAHLNSIQGLNAFITPIVPVEEISHDEPQSDKPTPA